MYKENRGILEGRQFPGTGLYSLSFNYNASMSRRPLTVSAPQGGKPSGWGVPGTTVPPLPSFDESCLVFFTFYAWVVLVSVAATRDRLARVHHSYRIGKPTAFDKPCCLRSVLSNSNGVYFTNPNGGYCYTKRPGGVLH